MPFSWILRPIERRDSGRVDRDTRYYDRDERNLEHWTIRSCSGGSNYPLRIPRRRIDVDDESEKAREEIEN